MFSSDRRDAIRLLVEILTLLLMLLVFIHTLRNPLGCDVTILQQASMIQVVLIS